MRKRYTNKLLFIIFLNLISAATFAQYQMENLDRGLVAVSMGDSKVFISWRWLGTEPENINFNLYRNGTKINTTPLTVTNYTDNSGSETANYTVRAIVNGTEQVASKSVTPWAQQYLKVPLQRPAGGTTISGEAFTYNANDASVADLDGDGQWEIILKWDPSNSKDNSQAGVTGSTIIDAYKLNGTRLWRINMGKNVRAGAHYTDFMVYDFDGDGKAEMMCKTADGTTDGTGKVIGSATVDYRDAAGRVLSGPEFFSIFNGQTGAVMATVNYIPSRGTVKDWGDAYGNRVDRFRAGVAYLDGKKPSGIFCRGYYTRLAVAAWDWDGKNLSNRWTFDTGHNSSNQYYGQGDHSLSIADVDNDGKQEIISGSAIIDDDGTGYYSNRNGHGDALHVSDMDPSLPGLEVFNIQEPVANSGAHMYSAKDKKVLWAKPSAAGSDEGPGRGVCADISAATKGAESWAAGGGVSGVFDCKGNVTGLATPSSCNFLVWWDGDLLRELLNNTMIDKYGTGRMLTAYNMAPIASNNGTKSTPCLSGDILGDWREEVIWRGDANDALYIFTTNIPSNYKLRTLMHDPQYRVAIAWQNTGYNQPPHVSYYLGDGMTSPPAPAITIVNSSVPANQLPAVSITAPVNNASYLAPATIVVKATATDLDGSVAGVEFYNGSELLTNDVILPYEYSWSGVAAGTYIITAKAKDDKGAVTTSEAITVVVKNSEGPVVSITSPLKSASFATGFEIKIEATATNVVGAVSKVEFFNGDKLLGTMTGIPYSLSLKNPAPGLYNLTAKATDNSNKSTVSEIITFAVGKSVQAETVCNADGIINETTNAGFNGTGYMNLNNAIGSKASWILNASAPVNTTLVIRYANGSATNRSASMLVNGVSQVAVVDFPSTTGWNTWNFATVPITLAAGKNTIELISATAEGAANIDELVFTTASDISVACLDNPASITVTSPENNSTINGNSIRIAGSSTDADGDIVKIEFLSGTQVIGNTTASPFTFEWNGVADGDYEIFARTTDSKGGTTTSSGIKVKVDNVVTGTDPHFVSGKYTSVYPNPTSDYFTIESRQEIESMSLTGLHGEQLTGRISGSNIHKRRLGEDLPAGVYLLQINYKSGDEQITRLIKTEN